MLRPLLRLARIPNVFTAFSNVAAGVLLARGGGFESDDLALVFASGALYTGGMTLNDYFDRQVDAKERPERPIPKGEIAPRTAARLGFALMAIGLALAAWHGVWRFVVAGLLATAIVLYDAWLKNTALGPLAMGSCRALNVGLGLSVSIWRTGWIIALPLGLSVFTLLITQLSQYEVGGTLAARLRKVLVALLALAVGLLASLIGLALASGGGALFILYALIPFTFVLVQGRRLFWPLLENAAPATIGRAIGGGILLMPAIDSAFVAASGAPVAAAVIFALAGPAYVLKRWYYLT
jgi:4-hydroxybenzoate polyprenyltransferase